MKNPLLKKLLPHAIALVLFLAVSALFCKPVLDGNVMNQHDNVGWKGMAQNAFEYKEKNGHFPLWNPNLFSGMPNYQVAMEGKTILPDTVKVLSLGLPKPMNFFFLACLCFYILALVFRVNPIVGMIGALAYSFSTYNPVIVAAGHDTQMLATAFMPLLMAGLISIYNKQYWLGMALTTFGTYQELSVNHLQVSYYFFLIAVLVTLGYLVKWIKEKDWKHIGLAAGLTVLAAVIGVAGNALVLMTTSEYSKFTMRGGKDISIDGDTVKKANTTGLDTGYAFEYSLGKAETFTLLMPNAFGGGSYARFGEGSKVAEKLSDKGFAPNQAEQIAQGMPKYWGKIFSAGPAYLGVFIFILGLIGFVIVRTPLRWGLLAATLLGIFMTWGKNFAGFNVFLFEHLPLYNKFRAPSFAQVIPQFTMAIMSLLVLQQLLFAEKSREFFSKNMKPILYTVGGLFALLALLYIGMDYSSGDDKGIISGSIQQTGNDEVGRIIVSALKDERQSMFGGQILRTLGIALLGALTLFLFVKEKISAVVAGIVLLVISTTDITVSSYKFFNNENDQFSMRPDNQKLFVSAEDYANTNFKASAFDLSIREDKSPNYRVFNMLEGPWAESRTSYFHKSIGGYHPAKLRIYQDIIERYFSRSTNPGVLNMLNTKYLITQSPFSGADTLIKRDEAFGPCWLVSHVKVVEDRVASINAIGSTNLRDTAIVEKEAATGLVQPQRDSLATISMTKYDNDEVEYEVNGSGPQFAVFSEIYYPKGWNAYVDGKKTDYINVNYLLRGMSVPAGKHTIKFVFEPESVAKGRSIMFIASILISLILVGGLFMAWKQSRKAS